jgi:hypothetical protein
LSRMYCGFRDVNAAESAIHGSNGLLCICGAAVCLVLNSDSSIIFGLFSFLSILAAVLEALSFCKLPFDARSSDGTFTSPKTCLRDLFSGNEKDKES